MNYLRIAIQANTQINKLSLEITICVVKDTFSPVKTPHHETIRSPKNTDAPRLIHFEMNTKETNVAVFKKTTLITWSEKMISGYTNKNSWFSYCVSKIPRRE